MFEIVLFFLFGKLKEAMGQLRSGRLGMLCRRLLSRSIQILELNIFKKE